MGTTAGGQPTRARRWLRRVRPRLRDVRRVRSGPGAGLKVGSRRASADYARGGNELPVQQALVDNLSPGGVCYDIGSNVGFFALLAAREVGPEGRVYAFEPVPDNVAELVANARRNRLHNVDAICAAVGEAQGELDLLLSAHPGGATCSSADVPKDLTGVLRTEVVTIDALVDTGRLLRPDVIKLDVEGYELQALRGMANTLARHRPVIVLEIDGADERVLRSKRDAVYGWLHDAGYDVDVLPASYSDTAWCVEHAVAAPRGPRT